MYPFHNKSDTSLPLKSRITPDKVRELPQLKISFALVSILTLVWIYESRPYCVILGSYDVYDMRIL